MNYLQAAKKEVTEVQKTLDFKEKREQVPIELTDEENYIYNVHDSNIISKFDDLRELCDMFIEESLLLDKPLLYKHHIGLRDFTTELLNLIQNCTETVIENQSEDEENTIDELNDIIIDELYTSKYF